MKMPALATVCGLLLVLICANGAFAQKAFVRDDMASDAIHLVAALHKEAGGETAGKTADQLRRAGLALVQANDVAGALKPLGAALAAAPDDWNHWLDYAGAARLAEPDDASQRYTLLERAMTAAYGAYEHARATSDKATALALLGDIAAKREQYRPAIDAYRGSLDLVKDDGRQAVYDDLREKYGFRILEYKIDNDSASPRVCFQFSETLKTGKTDFAPFVAVAGNSNSAVSADGTQLCVDGLKHGERYAVVLREGLPSSIGENLLKSADYDIYVKDRSPQVRFTSKNYVLPRLGQQGIPIVTVNTQKVRIDISRIGDRSLATTVHSDDFLAQLESGRAQEIADRDGTKIWTGTLDTAADLNKDVVTAFPVLQAVGKLQAGVYVMIARPATTDAAPADSADDGTLATQWFVVSDLGITAFSNQEGVHVLLRSLATAEPLSGVTVRLIARNNEVLASVPTDGSGHAQFDPGLARGAGGLEPGLLVATDAGGDYGFLDLSQNAFDLTDRGVAGRPAPVALDALLYTERGVYRSGETVFVTALLRDPKGVAVTGLPLTLVVKRPDGVEYKRVSIADQGLGGRSLTLPLLANVAPGTWRVEAYADPKGKPVGDTSFLVEDYVPERLDVRLKPEQTVLKPGEAATISVDANYLYGAPGAKLQVTGDITVEAAAGDLPGLKGYQIGLTDEAFSNVQTDLDEGTTTDAQGHASIEVPVPAVTSPKPVEAKIVLRVGEQGGRAVERVVTLPILPAGVSIAVRQTSTNLTDGSNADFDVVALAPDGTRVARKNLSWSLYRVEKNYQWFRTDGRWSYEPITATKKIADGKLDVGADADAVGHIQAPVGWGSHRIDIRGEDGHETSISFDVGWSGDATADTPDLLQMTLDKASYASGEDMKLRLASRFAGKATIAIVTDKIETFKTVDVAKGDTIVEMPVRAEWGAGAYAVVLAHRPLDTAAKRMPGRALGLAWFAIDEVRHTLDVSVGAPDIVRPRGPVTLPVTIAGLQPGEDADITLAAVDIGILNLTHYATPDPKAYFFGQRRLSTDIRDLYGLLIDGMQGTLGAIHSGGDGADKGLQGQVPTQEPLARYSGIVHVGADGKAQVTFDLPAFNGSVRVMAVAWTKTRVGHASSDVVVRDPVVVAGTLPRFLSLGDRSRFLVEIDNVEGAAGDYTADLDVHGPLVITAEAAHKSVHLDAKGRVSLAIPVTAAGVGASAIDLRLTGPAVDLTQRFAITIEPGTSALYRRSVRPLPADGAVTLSSDILADFVPGTGAVSIGVSDLGGIDVPALLQALDRYPYGCSEQIVSRAMPLLYVNNLAAMEQLAIDGSIEDRIRTAIDRVMSRQGASGAFGLWSVGSDDDDLWLDSFVADFLTRAREKGFAVPQKGFQQALDLLRNQVVNAGDIDADKGEPIAYAIYVLARNGRPVMGDLRYLADTKLDAFKTPLARAQIAAALALLGDRGRANVVFDHAVRDLQDETDGNFRPDYGSRLRDGAGTLALLAESGSARDMLIKASAVMDDAHRKSSSASTQEQAWMVLAAQALAKQSEGLTLTVDGAPVKGVVYRNYRAAALETKPVTIGNSGKVDVRMVVTVSGHPTVPEPPANKGYAIERSYYKLDGAKTDPKSLRQNDRLVVVLKVTEAEALQARVLLVDPLPAGLEIDNPALVDSGSIAALDWLKRDVEPVHAEYRDDRFVAAFNRESGQSAFFSVAYVVRAVVPGHYVMPPATIEDMYRPDRFGRTGFGAIDVTAAAP